MGSSKNVGTWHIEPASLLSITEGICVAMKQELAFLIASSLPKPHIFKTLQTQSYKGHVCCKYDVFGSMY